MLDSKQNTLENTSEIIDPILDYKNDVCLYRRKNTWPLIIYMGSGGTVSVICESFNTPGT